MGPELVLGGVIPADLLPFDGDLRIDEAHVRPPLVRLSDAEREEFRRPVSGGRHPQLSARR